MLELEKDELLHHYEFIKCLNHLLFSVFLKTLLFMGFSILTMLGVLSPLVAMGPTPQVASGPLTL